MYFQVKILQNGGKSLFTKKQATNKLTVKFLDVNCLQKGNKWNKHPIVYIFSIQKPHHKQ